MRKACVVILLLIIVDFSFGEIMHKHSEMNVEPIEVNHDYYRRHRAWTVSDV